MPRTRQIKHDFFLDEDLAECSRDSRLLFAGLWILADRRGRLEYRPKKIKAQLFPYDADLTPGKIDKLLEELAKPDRLFVIRYAVNGCQYIQVRSFEKHQHCHIREPESTMPAPPDGTCLHPLAHLAPDEHGASTGQAPVETQSGPSASTSTSTCGIPPRSRSGGTGGIRKKRSSTPATPPPDRINITEEMRKWAENVVPEIDIDFETDHFLESARAKGRIYSSWIDAWRNWMRRAPQMGGKKRARAEVGAEKTSGVTCVGCPHESKATCDPEYCEQHGKPPPIPEEVPF